MKNSSKIVFQCSNCGAQYPRWQGKCNQCEQWNTLVEAQPIMTSNHGGKAGSVIALTQITNEHKQRILSGVGELDNVLGGGIVPGSLILLGGDPGVGKSTLALQVALYLTEQGKKVLYVSGEESAHQIKLRSQRIDPNGNTQVFPETDLEVVVATLEKEKPALAIIDSVQTLYSSHVTGVVGGVSQIAFVTNTLMQVAKRLHIALLVIGHVTKDGVLAGPKMLEHMVDTVLYLEGDRFDSLRLLRCVKNRFGSTGEVGVFEMKEGGLVEVKNPGELFLEQHDKPLSGVCVGAILEGNKVLLLEIQALTNKTSFGYPKRASSGFDNNRLQLILAILQKRLKMDFSNQDVYINVAGGFDLTERAADLPVALAVLSSLKDVPLPEGLVAFGEIGLSGEIRGVTQADKRLKEAEKLGFSSVLLGGKNTLGLGDKHKNIKVAPLKEITELTKFI